MIHDVVAKIGQAKLEEERINIEDKDSLLSNFNKLYPVYPQTERLIPIRLRDDGYFIRFEGIGEPILQKEIINKAFYKTDQGNYELFLSIYCNKPRKKEDLIKKIKLFKNRLKLEYTNCYDLGWRLSILFNVVNVYLLYLFNNELNDNNKEEIIKLMSILEDYQISKNIEKNFYSDIIEEIKKQKNKKSRIAKFDENINIENLIEYFDNIFNIKEFIDNLNFHEMMAEAKCKDIITFSVYQEENNQEKLISEYNEYKEIALRVIKEFYEETEEEGECFICERRRYLSNKSLSHIGPPLNIFTMNKAVYNLNSVNDKNIYVNFPVCINCVMKMEYGAEAVNHTRPYRNYYDDFVYYILPNLPEEALIYYNLIREKNIENINEWGILDEGHQENIIEILNTEVDIPFTNKNILVDIVFTVENNGTSVRKVIPTTFKKINHFNNILKHVSKIEFFNETIKNKKDKFKEVEFHFNSQHMFLKELKGLLNYSFNPTKDDNSKNKYDKTTFLNIVEKIFKKEQINLDFLINKMIDKIQYMLRNQKDKDKFHLIRYTYYYYLYMYFVLLYYNKEVELNMDKEYFRESITEALNDMMEDLKIEKNPLKASFILGYLINQIEWKQKENKLSGSIVETIYKKVRNRDNLIAIYNKISEMILIRYKKLNYCKPCLKMVTELINFDDGYKYKPDEITFYLVSGYMLSKNIRTVRVNEKEEQQND